MPDWIVGTDPAAMAENYARYLVPAVFNTWTSETLQHLQARPEDNVLDVASGTGVTTFEVSRLIGPYGKVVGIDTDPGMLEIAERIRRARDLNNITFRQMDAHAIKYADAVFDRVVCQHALMFFDNQVGALREMFRVLAHGGRMVVTTWGSRMAAPHEALLAEAFHAYLPQEPSFFQTLFSLGERGDMERVLRDAGLRPHALVERVQRMANFTSSDSYWQGMVMGRPLCTLIESLPETVRNSIKLDAINRLYPYKSRSGYITPMEAVIVTITKP
jgi:ubiquinone/menaquinone biosynthesis C-methylase UbiE